MKALRRIALLAPAVVTICLSAAAYAHFNLNLNVRIFHVEHTDVGLRVYLRTPMPYLVADRVGPVVESGLPKAAPFTTNRLEDGKLVHFVDARALSADPLGLGRIAAEGLQLNSGGQVLQPKVVRVRSHPIGGEPGFATLGEAKAALGDGPTFPVEASETYVGDTIVDVLLTYEVIAPVAAYSLSSTLDPGLPEQDETANVILDHGPTGTNVFRTAGLMHEPVTVAASPAAAAWTFVIEGIRHILEGRDHVLFVLCLVLGAASLKSLVSRVTGFTIGHSVTLTAGFFGFVPKGAWFIPAVELGIALSIIYAAWVAIGTEEGRKRSEWTMFLVTVGIGLLHGLGFSFVLHEILRIDAPDLWASLLSFNLGVEIGQLAIVFAVWPALLLLRRASVRAWRTACLGIATIAIAIASVWTIQRAIGLGDALAEPTQAQSTKVQQL